MRKALPCSIALGILAFGASAEARRPYWGQWHHWDHGVWMGGWWSPPVAVYPVEPDRGYVDVDIEPEDARVYVDGREVGEADDFDGYPRYLPLKPGRHRVELRHKGYETLLVNVRMRAGWLLKLEDEMERGDPGKKVVRESTPPSAGDGDRARARREPAYGDDDAEDDDDADDDAAAPGQDAYEEEDGDPGEPGAREPPRKHESDRSQREERRRGSEGVRSARGAASLPLADGQGRVRFDVVPPEAAVYVDGEYRGNARQILGGGGIELPAGEHDVVVVHDGYEDREITISVAEGTTSEVNVELEEAQDS